MADVRLSALALIAAASISAADVFPVTDVDTGTTYKTTVAQLRTAILGAGVGTGWGASDYLGLGAGTVPSTGMIRSGQGAITADSPLINATVTWDNVAVTFRGILLNVTDTTSATASMFADFQLAGVSKFSVGKSGIVKSVDGYYNLLPNASNTFNAFALKGRDLSVGSAVSTPFFVPSGTATNQKIALDLVVQGTPTDTTLRGVAWIDVCDANEAAMLAGNYECLTLGKFIGGYAHVSAAAGGTGTLRSLVLQLGGGAVSVGPTQLPSGVTTTLGTFPHNYIAVNPDTNTNALRASGLISMSYGQRNSWWAVYAGGTVTIPAATTNAAVLFQLGTVGFDGTAYGTGPLWSVLATEAWSPGNHGARVDIHTVPNGSITGAIAATFGQDKSLTVVGAFGCNGATARTSAASGGALNAYAAGANGLSVGADMSALHALVVAMRAALVNNGILS